MSTNEVQTEGAEKLVKKFTRKQFSMVGIPSQSKLKTIACRLERPAVDIEFHDLLYTVKTANGEYTSW